MATKKVPGGSEQRRAASSGREVPIADQSQDEEELEEAGAASPQDPQSRVGTGPTGATAVAASSSALDDHGTLGQQQDEEEEIPPVGPPVDLPQEVTARTPSGEASIRISGIDGESTDDKHESEIDLAFGAGARSEADELAARTLSKPTAGTTDELAARETDELAARETDELAARAIGKNGLDDPGTIVDATDSGTIVEATTDTGTIVEATTDQGTIVDAPTIARSTARSGYDQVSLMGRADDYGQGLVDSAAEVVEGAVGETPLQREFAPDDAELVDDADTDLTDLDT